MSTEDELVASEPSKTTVSETSLSHNSTLANGQAKNGVSETKQQNSSSRRFRQKKTRTLNEVVARLAACARCSFFLAGYRLAQGEESLEKAVEQMNSDCLDLTWDPATRELVHKSYGCRVDIDCFHWEGQCILCQRRFVYEAADGEGKPAAFYVEL